jgi:DNA-binding transcriptional MerR regulator
MTVNELAKQAEVSPGVVRFYARIGLLKPVRHSGNRYRLFSDADARRLLFILRAKGLGYTIAEIAEILKQSGKGKSPCPLVRDVIRRRITENRQRLDGLNALQLRMEKALVQWNRMPNRVPTGDSICFLIESADGL